MPELVDGPTLADRIDEGALVRKQVRHFPEKPCFVLAFVPRVPWYRDAGHFGVKLAGALIAEVRFREPLLVFSLHEDRALLKSAPPPPPPPPPPPVR